MHRALHQRVVVAAALHAAVLLTALAAASPACAQAASAQVTVTVTAEGQPLPGAEVRTSGAVVLTGAAGQVRLTVPAGPHRLLVWKPGYAVDTVAVSLVAAQDTALAVDLAVVAQEQAPIIVHAARSETRIEQEPERVEVLAPEDVQEKSLTRPGDMTNLLVEMGAIHVQPVAPGLGGATIRVQGLPGQYTLLLADGLPSYGSQAPAFSLVQAPPLDLRQVEVIKGAATALYGPAALGGVVDLVSRLPAHERSIVLSQTSRGGSDGLLWLSRRINDRWGYTLLGGGHRQSGEDVNGDGWSDIAGYRRLEARPRLFWNGQGGSSLLVTAGGVAENRTGGTLPGATLPTGAAFPETLDTRHGDVGLIGRVALSPRTVFAVRTSGMVTRHERDFGGVQDRDTRSTAFGEATVAVTERRHALVVGTAAQYDGLRALPSGLDYDFGTASLFAQDTYTPVEALSLEASARLDRHNRYGTFASPRASALFRFGGGHAWSIRASAGSGFNAPTPLVPEVEETGLHALVPPGPLAAERGRSFSLDAGGTVGSVQLNGTLFDVEVAHPVLPVTSATDSGRFTLVNAAGPIRSAGLELFAVYAREPLLVTATYAHDQASELTPEEGRRLALPLTPRNAGGIDVALEDDESGARVALEVFYTGRQRVEEDPYRTFTPGFATVELIGAKRFGHIEVFANAENLTDVRQTRWDPLLLPRPGRGGRWTTDEWAPLEGRVLNAGVRLRL